MKINHLAVRKILASQGDETIEVEIETDSQKVAASVPAGISAGKHEVVKVPTAEAVTQIENISGKIIGQDWEQSRLDEFLLSKKMGGNATLAISAAFFKLTISRRPSPTSKFPQLMVLLFEGAKHGNKNIKMQEFLLLEDSVAKSQEDFEKLRQYLKKNNIETLVGAEGGFSPQSLDDFRILDTIKLLFPKAEIALDAAGSFKTGEIDYYELLSEYSITSLEDPYSDEDWAKWQEFYGQFSHKVLIVGDDLTVTNTERIKMAVEKKVINAVIIKPNQNGTITGTLEAVKMAKESGLKIIVSHRGQETDDDWIVDFALAVQADYVKFGGMDRGERVAKYNRLMALGMS